MLFLTWYYWNSLQSPQYSESPKSWNISWFCTDNNIPIKLDHHVIEWQRSIFSESMNTENTVINTIKTRKGQIYPKVEVWSLECKFIFRDCYKIMSLSISATSKKPSKFFLWIWMLKSLNVYPSKMSINIKPSVT